MLRAPALRWGVVGSVGLLAILMGAVSYRPVLARSHSMDAKETIPAAPFSRFEKAKRSEMLAYAKSLEFDSSYHARDTRRLMYRQNGDLIEGPMATVEPAVGSAVASIAEMRAGRIIARVTVDGFAPRHGFAPGVNYYWVEAAGDGMRAIVVSADSTVPIQSFSFAQKHANVRDPGSTSSEVRFRWNDVLGMDTIWMYCVAAGCCETGSDHFGGGWF